METKEYIVILEDGIDYNTVWTDIESTTSGLPHIPDRAVAIVNNRDVQPRMCHYALTDDEAEKLESDHRVLAVERPLADIGLFPITFDILGPSNSNISFTIPSYSNHSGNNVNWGLIRHAYSTNQYGSSTTTSAEYKYVLDGTGVDIVIMDTGIEYYHPEFLDSSGNTRVVLYNWTGNLDTNPNSINFNDIDGHGTACASIAAGKNYGWAKNARIYPCKIQLTGVGAGAIDVGVAIDAVKTWHIAKNTPGNPIYSGRPTVVNASFGTTLSTSSISLTSINYRNQGDIPATTPDVSKGMTNGVSQVDLASGAVLRFSSGQPYRSNQIDTVIDSLISSGVVFVAAAGNDAHKIATPTDSSNKTNDYWNYWNGTYNNVSYPISYRYYNRGSSPGTASSIVVGALVAGTNSNGKSQKISYSNAGYNVDVFAVGWTPRSAISNINSRGASGSAPYWLNGLGQTFRQTNFGGTSAAAPQVVGMVALYLQKYKTATPAEVKKWLSSNTNKDIMYSAGDSDYTNHQSQWGGTGGVAYQNLQGLLHVKDSTGAWKEVKAVWVNDNGTWKRAKASYHNINGTWTPTYTG